MVVPIMSSQFQPTNHICEKRLGISLVFGIWMRRVIKGPFCTIRLGTEKCLETKEMTAYHFKIIAQIYITFV